MPCGNPVGDSVFRIAAFENGIEVPAIEESIEPAGRVFISFALAVGIGGRVYVHDPQLRPWSFNAYGLAGPAMGKQHMMRGAQCFGRILVTGRVVPLFVSECGGAPGFVVSGPLSNAIA